MKVLIVKHSEGDSDNYMEEIDAVFLVPNTFYFNNSIDDKEDDRAKLYKEWVKNTWKQYKRNGKLINRYSKTISFVDWLSKKYKKIEFTEKVV